MSISLSIARLWILASVSARSINAETGARAQPGDKRVIWEAFLAGTEPSNDNSYILDGNGVGLLNAGSAVKGQQSPVTVGLGGLY